MSIQIGRFVDATVSFFCQHEWSSRHDHRRWYLECIKCRATTPGIELGGPPKAEPARLMPVALRLDPGGRAA